MPKPYLFVHTTNDRGPLATWVRALTLIFLDTRRRICWSSVSFLITAQNCLGRSSSDKWVVKGSNRVPSPLASIIP